MLAAVMVYGSFLFTDRVHPHIPYAWGGAAGINVRLLANKNGRDTMIAAGIPFQSETFVSEEVQLLMNTNDSYVIRISKQQTDDNGAYPIVHLKHDLIEAVLYSSEPNEWILKRNLRRLLFWRK